MWKLSRHTQGEWMQRTKEVCSADQNKLSRKIQEWAQGSWGGDMSPDLEAKDFKLFPKSQDRIALTWTS